MSMMKVAFTSVFAGAYLTQAHASVYPACITGKGVADLIGWRLTLHCWISLVTSDGKCLQE